MRRLMKTLGWLLICVIIVILALGTLLLLDNQPLVEQDRAVTDAERAWVRDWIAGNRPHGKQSGDLITLVLTERQINLLANALLNQLGQGRVAVRLDDGHAQIAASLNLPWNPLGSVINLELALVEHGQRPTIEAAHLAGLPLPSSLVQTLANRALAAVESSQSLQQVDLQDDQIRIIYTWRPDLLERIGSGFMANADLPTVLRYQEDLSLKVAGLPRRKSIKLADLLAHLLARAGAQPANADPVAENRALILTLTAYVNGRTILDPADSKVSVTPPRPHPVLLRERQDLSQHFMTSAALAIQGSDTLSGMVGWYKEMSDANGGSGFSFADMAANRAGIRFAQLATANQDSARQVQRMAGAGLTEDDFMPAIDGLPEGMNQRTFATQFGSQNKIEYQTIMDHIDRRIDASRLFRTPTP